MCVIMVTLKPCCGCNICDDSCLKACLSVTWLILAILKASHECDFSVMIVIFRDSSVWHMCGYGEFKSHFWMLHVCNYGDFKGIYEFDMCEIMVIFKACRQNDVCNDECFYYLKCWWRHVWILEEIFSSTCDICKIVWWSLILMLITESPNLHLIYLFL